jgi:hypothetical protein
MRLWLSILAVIAGLGSSFSSFVLAQTVCIGADGKPCPVDPQMRWCKAEPTPANLRIVKPAHFSGVLFDKSGAPITFEHPVAQLREPATGKVLFSSPVDEHGAFDFTAVPPGDFRFIVFSVVNAKPVRLPLMDQPKLLHCDGEPECKVKVVLDMHGTDNPIDFCPPK